MKDNELYDLWNGIQALGKIIDTVSEGINEFVSENREALYELRDYFENYSEINAKIWQEAAEFGWFPNDFISMEFVIHTESGQECLDEYMSHEIENVVNHIHDQLVDLYPARKAIIDVAFNLHKERNYIAAIPLFLSQTDGICAQSIGSYLFSGNEQRMEKIKQLIMSAPHKAIILAPLTQETQFGARIANAKTVHKAKAPNRNGILHGSRKHLDYATKINSLKCISLLAYVGTIFVDEK
ncbi:TPA: hypothetical protein ACPJ2O_004430 [Vibrio diabolicus]